MCVDARSLVAIGTYTERRRLKVTASNWLTTDQSTKATNGTHLQTEKIPADRHI